MFTIESGDARLTVSPEEGGRIVGFSVDASSCSSRAS